MAYMTGESIQDIEVLIQLRDEAEAECWKQLKEDSRIADNMRDYWKHQNSGAE